MKVNGEELQTLEVFPNMMTVPDCVVLGPNKLGRGHGEAKFYIASKEDMYAFYGHEAFEDESVSGLCKKGIASKIVGRENEYDPAVGGCDFLYCL